MRRREFIAALGGAVAWPMVARAQQKDRMPSIGVFVPGSPQTHEQYVSAFGSALDDLGYGEGHKYALNIRWGEGGFDRFRDYATELVTAKPEVILATGTSVLSALKQATQTLPIVFVQIADPVTSGFVESLAHPGGNISGFTNYEPGMTGKWLELLKEIAPGLSRAALIFNSRAASAGGSYFLHVFEAAAGALSVKPIAVPFHDPTEIESLIAKLKQAQAGGVVVMPEGSTLVNRDILLGLASRLHVPAVYPFREFPASAPSPVSFTKRPRLPTIKGSMVSRRVALRRASVPSSSIDIRREYPTTSAARIAASRRWTSVPGTARLHSVRPSVIVLGVGALSSQRPF